jgi:hypothetical protein
MQRNRVWAMLIGLLFTAVLSAQSITVSGTIVDAETEEPLVGASIVVNGANGTVTDLDGAFEYRIPASSKSLIISYVGYMTQEIELGEDAGAVPLRIAMQVGSNLSEVVVTALGPGARKPGVGLRHPANRQRGTHRRPGGQLPR